MGGLLACTAPNGFSFAVAPHPVQRDVITLCRRYRIAIALCFLQEWKWSAWDSLELEGADITLQQLFDIMKDKYGLEVTMLSHGVSILYSFFANKKKIAVRSRRQGCFSLWLEITTTGASVRAACRRRRTPLLCDRSILGDTLSVGVCLSRQEERETPEGKGMA